MMPWKAKDAELAKAGVALATTYPRPIIDHQAARDREKADRKIEGHLNSFMVSEACHSRRVRSSRAGIHIPEALALCPWIPARACARRG
jgi:hypothetical protein